MAGGFASVYALLKPILAKYEKRLAVKTDTPAEYILVTKSASPFPQHKGHPMYFGAVRLGKAYVSFHLMPLYMSPPVAKAVSPALKKRMQGKSCFNFKTDPGPELLDDLKQLTAAAFAEWREKKWV